METQKSIKIVTIEGNIGSGKSTLLENLRNVYKNNSNIYFLREPVSEWESIKDKDGNTMLQKFYADQEKYSFAFQMMAYISRLKILRETLDHIMSLPNSENPKNNSYIIVTERCLHTDRYVFAKMLYDQKKIEDVCYQIYSNWFDEFARICNIDTIIYVNTNPIICYNRIHKRSREGEELIPLEYLESCHKYHDEFLTNEDFNSSTKLYLDGNIDIYENNDTLYEWLNKIQFTLSMYGDMDVKLF